MLIKLQNLLKNTNIFILLLIVALFLTSVNKSVLIISAMLLILVILSIAIDKIGHVMQYISLSKLTKSLEDANFKIKKSEKLFRDFFTQTHIPMCIFDLKILKFVKVNKCLSDLLEYTEEELIEKNLEDIIYHEDIKESRDVAILNLNNQKKDYHINRYITKSGKVIKLKWTFTEGDELDISYCVATLIEN